MWDSDRGSEVASGTSTDEHSSEKSALLPLLAEPRRRRLLRIVRREGPIGLGTLTSEIAAADVAGDRASPHHCREVYLEVHHVDIPLLSGAGLVAYDEESGTVSLTVSDTRLEEVIADVDDRLSTTG